MYGGGRGVTMCVCVYVYDSCDSILMAQYQADIVNPFVTTCATYVGCGGR